MKLTYKGTQIAILLAILNGFLMTSLYYPFGIFAKELQMEFGWSDLEVNGALSMAFFAGLTSLFYGRLADKFGIKKVMFFGFFIVSLGYLLRPMTDTLSEWYLFNAMVFSSFPLYSVASGKLIPLWFPEKRARVMGFVSLGDNFWSLSLPLIASFLIIISNWEIAYIFFGTFVLFFAFISLFLVTDSFDVYEKERKRIGKISEVKEIDQAKFGLGIMEAFFSIKFWVIMISTAMSGVTLGAFLAQIPQHYEFSDNFSSIIPLLIMSVTVGAISAKIFLTRLSEKISITNTVILSMYLQVLGIAIIIISQNIIINFFALFIFGLGMGGIGPLFNLLVGEQFGMKNYGLFAGMGFLIWSVLSSVIPFIQSILRNYILIDNIGLYFVIILLLFFSITLFSTRYFKKYNYKTE